MTELQKLPFILNNLKIIDRDYIKKKSKRAIVIKKRYKNSYIIYLCNAI